MFGFHIGKPRLSKEVNRGGTLPLLKELEKLNVSLLSAKVKS